MMYYPEQAQQFVVCIDNNHYQAALEVGKIYSVLPDTGAAAMQMLRVIDESGADYLYATSYFLPIDLPQSIQDALRKAA
jgi:hypothetical protein